MRQAEKQQQQLHRQSEATTTTTSSAQVVLCKYGIKVVIGLASTLCIGISRLFPANVYSEFIGHLHASIYQYQYVHVHMYNYTTSHLTNSLYYRSTNSFSRLSQCVFWKDDTFHCQNSENRLGIHKLFCMCVFPMCNNFPFRTSDVIGNK